MRKLHLSITIEEVNDEKGKGFCATIRELNNSLICADSLDEIFQLVPDAIEIAQKDEIGIFAKKAPSKKQAA